MKKVIRRFIYDREAQDLIEYALLSALIAVMLVVAMTSLSDETTGIFSGLITALRNAIL